VEEGNQMSPPAKQATGPEVADPRWKVLYAIGGVAALVAVVFFRRNCGAELMGFQGFGFIDVPATLPSSAVDWFALLQEDRLLGLVLLDFVDVVNYVLLCLVFLALYGALHRANKSAMTVATTFGFVGITVYFASNQAFAMLSLNDRYAAATTEAQRSTFLAAGEALLAISRGTGIYLSLFLVVLAGLIISIVMLRSGIFGKATAYVGIVANGLRLGYFIALAFAPTLIALPIVISAPFRVLWYILIALGLFRLAASASDERGAQDGR
jgi:hypothetical protein